MQDQLCSECDMPVMKYKDLIECVFCPKEVKEEISEPVKDEVREAAKSDTVLEEKQDPTVMNNGVSVKPAEAPKPVKEVSLALVLCKTYLYNGSILIVAIAWLDQLSQAEIIAERLRGMQSKGYGENV